jgi:hypothetical protein
MTFGHWMSGMADKSPLSRNTWQTNKVYNSNARSNKMLLWGNIGDDHPLDTNGLVKQVNSANVGKRNRHRIRLDWLHTTFRGASGKYKLPVEVSERGCCCMTCSWGIAVYRPMKQEISMRRLVEAPTITVHRKGGGRTSPEQATDSQMKRETKSDWGE